MKIVIAPDKFKGSLTGFEFCDAVAEGLKKVHPNIEVLKMPMADGGDGTAAVVNHYMKGAVILLTAKDPLFRTIETSYLYDKKRSAAYIEMARISGLQLLSEEERNCMNTTSFGTGELIVDALKRGAQDIILGIGGSATNDGGMGMAEALGIQFLDAHGNQLKPIGKNLSEVRKIEVSNLSQALDRVNIKVACDVANPFYGENGAAHVYAKQKGVSLQEIELLDTGLNLFAKVIYKQFNIDLQQIQGSGAAGGLGGGAVAFLGGRLVSGIQLVQELARFDEAIDDADWIVTGEGKLDTQTFSGKTIAGIIDKAKQKNISVAALCGSVDISEEQATSFGLDYVAAIGKDALDLKESIANAYPNLIRAAQRFARSL